jgi:ABC-type multidrug transport system fused ATPase/permease subunit
MYLGIYAAIGAGASLFQITMDTTFLLSCARASKLIHEKLLYRIMRSPMSFFDTNPIGRILNRFSSDISMTDGQLPFQVYISRLWIMYWSCFFLQFMYNTMAFNRVN